VSALLVADCVGKSFRGRRVLSSASLRAVEGEFRVLLGRNGSGKSTLLKIAAGWTAPDSGTLSYDGELLHSASLPALARRGVFFLPDHDLLSNAFTVRTQLEMLRRQFDGASIAEAATKMRVSELLDVRPAALSGGERRRAELAAVFVRRPRCVLADEPYRGVAPLDAERLTEAFTDLAASGVAVVATGHEVPTLLAAAHHVTWCTSGTTYELGAPAMAEQHEQFAREYLGQYVLSRAPRP
jgi:ABC-type multidrug transport system ATPase subunit